MKKVPEDWKTVTWGQLLTDQQAVQVGRFIGRKDSAGLKTYLRSIKADLAKREVDPDYLFYLLAYEFKLALH